MSQRLLAVLAVLALTSSSLVAQTLTIDHQPVGCAVAEKFPWLEARFAPADTVATARVLFQPENTQQWYAVAMKSEGPAFSGVLPKPKKSLKAYRYYIEVTDKALATNRTADYTTNVVASAGECKGKIMAAALGSASVLLQVPVGAAALPAGFASTGVVAAGSGSAAAATGAAAGGGGGLSTGAVVGIVAGAGAAAVGVAVAAGKGGDKGSSATSATSYTGPVTGQLTVTRVTSFGPNDLTCSWVRALSGTMTVTLQQSNGTVTGTAGTTVIFTEIGRTGSCDDNGPFSVNSSTCAVTGTPGNLACSEQRTSQGPTGTSRDTFGFSGALSGGVISGMVTWGLSGQGGGVATVGGPFTFTVNGLTTFSVTLR